MRTLLIITAMAFVLGCVPAAWAREQVLEVRESGQIAFMMPSGNIDCIYTPKGGAGHYTPADGGPELSCDRIAPRYVNIRLGASGPAVLTEDPEEQPCCSGDAVLAYGNTVRLGNDFICSSSDAGLVCETPDKKHGLCLSRTRTLHY